MSYSSDTKFNNIHCPSCGKNFHGKFCYNCGEKVFHPSDLEMKKFFAQTVDIFTHFDSKFIRSVKYLFLRPGYLPKAYVTGNRVKYAKPMQVFLLANILFYFITQILNVKDYSPPFGDHNYFLLSDHWLFSWAKGFDNLVTKGINYLGDWKEGQLHLKDEQFAEIFSQNSWIYSKTFIILLIPLYAITLWIFLGKKFRYFGSTVIFSTFFVAFQLITFSVMSYISKIFYTIWKINIYQCLSWLFFKTPLRQVSQFLFEDFELSNIIFWFPYLFIAFQYFFKGQTKWWINLIAAFLLSKTFYYLTFGVYKKILIVATVLLMHHTGHH